MKIDIISKSTLKLTLTAADMSRYNLHYEQLTGKGTQCRKALGLLLQGADKPESAAMAARLLEDERRLFVEAFRRMDGGCMLYVSALSEHRKKPLLDESRPASPVMFETTSEEDLGKLCRCLLAERKNGAEFSSRLFFHRGRYRLAVIPNNTCRARLIRIFGEFGGVICSELSAAFTEEHFTVIAGEKGAETAAKIF